MKVVSLGAPVITFHMFCVLTFRLMTACAGSIFRRGDAVSRYPSGLDGPVNSAPLAGGARCSVSLRLSVQTMCSGRHSFSWGRERELYSFAVTMCGLGVSKGRLAAASRALTS